MFLWQEASSSSAVQEKGQKSSPPHHATLERKACFIVHLRKDCRAQGRSRLAKAREAALASPHPRRSHPANNSPSKASASFKRADRPPPAQGKACARNATCPATPSGVRRRRTKCSADAALCLI